MLSIWRTSTSNEKQTTCQHFLWVREVLCPHFYVSSIILSAKYKVMDELNQVAKGAIEVKL